MIPLRLVLDTNIIISAALKPDGLERTTLQLALTNPARLYVTAETMAEYQEVLVRPKMNIRKGLQQQLLQLIRCKSYLIRSVRPVQAAPDPDDNKFLECANAARADYLVTGNVRHFPKFWMKTTIITSRDFISTVAQRLIT